VAIPSTYATFTSHVTTVSYTSMSEGTPVELPVWATGFFKRDARKRHPVGVPCVMTKDAKGSTKAPWMSDELRRTP
jgi:hypothetical protein